MNLYTGCPKCRTTFRVTTQQLQASVGQVRCGFCGEVFDAFATLTAHEPRADAAPADAAAPAREFPPEALAPPPPVSAPVTPAAAPRPDPAAGLYEWEFRMPAAPSRTGLWVALSLLLTVLLGAQAAYAYRTELSIVFPPSRPWIEKACDLLGCRISNTRLSSFLHIEASDLKAVDAGAPNEIELTASIRNRAPIELAYPAFELTLTDGLDQAIARRVLMPHEYLPAGSSGALGPGAELGVHLFLDTGELRAAGYRLYLFYP
jgi:predicted Zn finger-like uncharacterized protein